MLKKESIVTEIISLQIKCYKNIFSLNDQVYGSYLQYYIDITAVDPLQAKCNLDMSIKSVRPFFYFFGFASLL